MCTRRRCARSSRALTKLTPDTCPEMLPLDMDHLNVLQTRFHSQAMVATLMMTVSTIIPPSDFATHKKRIVEILSGENLNNAKILDDSVQNIKGLLSLSDLRDAV